MIVYLAIGSNLAGPVKQVLLAIDALKKLPATKFLKQSSLYLTTPLGYLAQPSFINLVAKLETQLDALPLLAHLHQIEAEFGRQKTIKNGPRVIDLDILFYGRLKINADNLQVPHPRMWQRDFVVKPLAEITFGVESDLDPLTLPYQIFQNVDQS